MFNRLLIALGWRGLPQNIMVNTEEQGDSQNNAQSSTSWFQPNAQLYRLLMNEGRKQELLELTTTFNLLQNNFKQAKNYFENFLEKWKQTIDQTIQQPLFSPFLAEEDEVKFKECQLLIQEVKQSIINNFAKMQKLIVSLANNELKLSGFARMLECNTLQKTNEALKNALEHIVLQLNYGQFASLNSLFLMLSHCSMQILDTLLTQLDLLFECVNAFWTKLLNPEVSSLQKPLAAEFQQLIESPLQFIFTSINQFQNEIDQIEKRMLSTSSREQASFLPAKRVG